MMIHMEFGRAVLGIRARADFHWDFCLSYNVFQSSLVCIWPHGDLSKLIIDVRRVRLHPQSVDNHVRRLMALQSVRFAYLLCMSFHAAVSSCKMMISSNAWLLSLLANP